MTLNPELMALMVHDLKNPLAALLANLGFIGSSVSSDEMAKEAVDDCLLSTEVLTRLIDNLAMISRLEESESLGGDATVASAVQSVDARMRRHAAASSMRLESTCEPDVGGVPVPASLLELALDNMIGSSLAYAPSGSIIRVEAKRNGNEVLISVHDDGPPLEKEMRTKIGELEGQLDLKGSLGARYARGFGLYVASKITTVAGGRFEASEGGSSCTLQMILPSTR